MAQVKRKRSSLDLKVLVEEDQDLLRSLMREALQEVLEAEMDEALQTGKGSPSLPAFQELLEGVSVRCAPVLDCMWAGRLAEMLAVDVAVLAEG